MSDRVAVFESGSVVQVGTPDALYNEPQSAFVANFIGENNTLEGIVERISEDRCQIALAAGLSVIATPIGNIGAGDQVQLTIRPERISIATEGGENWLRATAAGRIYLGDHQRLLARLESGQVLTVKVGAETAIAAGQPLALTWSPAHARAFPVRSRDDVSNPGRSS